MNRRDLLKGLGAAAASGAGGLGLSRCRRKDGAGATPGVRPKVALLPCRDYDPRALLEAVRAGWSATRPPEVRGKRVLLKPNIADFSPDRPIHTDPRLVEALILVLREAGARDIVVGEGAPQNRDAEWLFRATGYEDLARRQSVPLVDLNYDDLRIVPNADPRATVLRRLHLPETVLRSEVVVSVAKMKTHKLAGVTLSLKNMFGVVPGMKYGWPKNALHWNGIARSVCEIAATVKTHYAVVDGVVGMEGHGPIMGAAKPAGVLVMGAGPLSVDAVAARVMGVDPARVEHLALARRARLGALGPEEIEVAGPTPGDVRTDFALHPDFAGLRAD